MNSDEFGEWSRYHKAAFPGLGEWLRRNPETLDHWQRALTDVDLEAAKECTDQMLSGEIETPRGYSEHVRTVRTRSKELLYAGREESVPSRIDGEQVYSCHLCLDSGYVLVLDPERGGQELLDWARSDRSQPWPASRCTSVACTCLKGERERERLATRSGENQLPPRKIDRYDTTRHFRCNFQYGNPDAIQTKDWEFQGLIDWIERRYEWLPAA
jgi:hypothetical protein